MIILAWDLETTDLSADFGALLAAGVGRIDPATGALISRPRMISALTVGRAACSRCHRRDVADDAAVVARTIRVLNTADAWVTWYGARFDLPFLVSRAVDHRLAPPRPVPMIDLWTVARRQLRLTSNRLLSVSDFLRTPTKKTPLVKLAWRLARDGHTEGLQQVIEHCRRDVEALAQVYQTLRPLVRRHPCPPDWLAARRCRVCGGATLASPLKVTVNRRYPQEEQRCPTCRAAAVRTVTRLVSR